MLKAKCRGHFVKNKRYQEMGKEYFTIVQMIVKEEVTNILLLEQDLMPDYAHPAHPPPYKHTHTHTHTHTLTKKDTDYLMTSIQPTQPFFPIPITMNAQVFLSHSCPKIKEILFQSSHKQN